MLPKVVEALREVRITLISGGWRHTMAADDTGQLYGWGWNRVSTMLELSQMHHSHIYGDLADDPILKSTAGAGSRGVPTLR